MEKIRRRLGSGLGRLRRTPGGEPEGEPKGRDIVITGPGRSGTTLTCFLLNKVPGTVALAEPLTPGRFEELLPDNEAVADAIEEAYRRIRRRALRHGVVPTKHVGGAVPDNTKGEVDGVRKRVAVKGKIPVGKDLNPDFYLAIKQPGMFTALLPTLTKRFPCYAIVRNPLAIVASSGSVRANKRREKPPAMVRYDPEFARHMRERRRGGADRLSAQLESLGYTFDRYLSTLPADHVLRYEDIVASGGKALSAIVPAAAGLDEPLENQNANPKYDRETVLRCGERLLESEGAYWKLYSREDVEGVLDTFR